MMAEHIIQDTTRFTARNWKETNAFVSKAAHRWMGINWDE